MTKKHIINCFILFLICSIVCSCSQTNKTITNKNGQPESMEVLYNDLYETVLWHNSETGIESPTGIICRDNDIIVCDEIGNQLVILDYDGNLVRTVGKLGYGELEFVEPTGIVTLNDMVYVLDAGNNRIQILTKDLNFSSSIPLTPMKFHALGYRYTSIAVNDNGDIYVTSDSTNEINTFVSIIRDDKVINIDKQIAGYVSYSNHKIYATNIMELFINEAEFSVTGTLGYHSLFEINNDKLKEVFSFPYKYGSADFVVMDSSVYVVSIAHSRLDRFTLNGEYVESLANFYDETKLPDETQLSIYTYVTNAPNGDFFVTDKQNNVIYKITQKQ